MAIGDGDLRGRRTRAANGTDQHKVSVAGPPERRGSAKPRHNRRFARIPVYPRSSATVDHRGRAPRSNPFWFGLGRGRAPVRWFRRQTVWEPSSASRSSRHMGSVRSQHSRPGRPRLRDRWRCRVPQARSGAEGCASGLASSIPALCRPVPRHSRRLWLSDNPDARAGFYSPGSRLCSPPISYDYRSPRCTTHLGFSLGCWPGFRLHSDRRWCFSDHPCLGRFHRWPAAKPESLCGSRALF